MVISGLHDPSVLEGDAPSSPRIWRPEEDSRDENHGDDGASPSNDARLLDPYSATVAAVVRRVAPSVVNIPVLSGERGSRGGSGFILSHDGFILVVTRELPAMRRPLEGDAPSSPSFKRRAE
ncbi:hypothetical protein BH20VER3_BH20VER3_14190 [soil metagenome]